MPAGYTYKRRIGWFYYNAGITNFVQRNAQFTWVTGRTLASGASASTNFSLATFCPPNASRVFGTAITNNNNVTILDNTNANILVQIATITSGQCYYAWSFTPQNTTYQIVYYSSSSGGALIVLGWEDNI
jgi:hypothetical protein